MKATKLKGPTEILTKHGARRFFRWLLKVERLNFHPDTDFRTYVNGTGERVYGAKEAAHLNKLMRQTFDVMPDVYALAVEEFEKHYDQASSRKDRIKRT